MNRHIVKHIVKHIVNHDEIERGTGSEGENLEAVMGACDGPKTWVEAPSLGSSRVRYR
jgi:hypothetical protein